MIIEGLLTTQTAEGAPHVAPMGPVVDESLHRWTLRPFQSSTTFKNLQSTPHAIFHVVDDALSIVQTILKQPSDLAFRRNEFGWVIDSACHWYALEIDQWDTSAARSEASAQVIASQTLRPFWGWNRAKHAVLEATILITRLHILDMAFVESQFEHLEVAVEKTAGERERQAWTLLREKLETAKSKANRGASSSSRLESPGET